jgi:hypothetical protein
MGDLWSQLQSKEQGFNNREFKWKQGSQKVRWFSCAELVYRE